MNILLTGDPVINETVFETIVNAAKSVLELFTEFPINVFLAFSVIGIAVGVIKRLKRN